MWTQQHTCLIVCPLHNLANLTIPKLMCWQLACTPSLTLHSVGFSANLANKIETPVSAPIQNAKMLMFLLTIFLFLFLLLNTITSNYS